LFQELHGQSHKIGLMPEALSYVLVPVAVAQPPLLDGLLALAAAAAAYLLFQQSGCQRGKSSIFLLALAALVALAAVARRLPVEIRG
jgi:hypothetical protein